MTKAGHYNPSNFSDVRDPIVRAELRKLWQVVQAQRQGDRRAAVAKDLDNLRRRLATIKPPKKKGYRSSTISDGQSVPGVAAAAGAPDDATYILMDHNALLPNHRRLQAGTGLTLTDGGAGGNATLASDALTALGGHIFRSVVTSAWGGGNNSLGMNNSAGATSAAFAASVLGQHVRILQRAATTGTVAFAHSSMGGVQWIWRGNAAALGGFHYRHVIGMENVTAATRWFIGLRNSTSGTAAAANWETGLIECVVVGSYKTSGSGDTGIYVYHNDNAGNATVVSTGLSWAQGDVIQVDIACDSNASTITVGVSVLTSAGSSSLYTGTLSSNLPQSATFMTPVMQLVSGLNAQDMAHIYLAVDQPYGV